MPDLQARVRYALRAVLYLSENYRPEEPVTVAKIAAQTEVPAEYLAQILLSLKRAALANSTRGPGGGYWLVRPPAHTTVWDVVRAVERDAEFNPDAEVAEAPYDGPINRLWRRVAAKRREILSGVTLADLLEQTT